MWEEVERVRDITVDWGEWGDGLRGCEWVCEDVRRGEDDAGYHC